MPIKLRMTPPVFFHVMGSFSAMAAIIMVYMGDSAVSMEQSMGVMYGMPAKKVYWHTKNPNIDAATIFSRSFFSTFSLGINSDISQNNPPAPNERKQKIVSGDSSCPLVKSLQTMMLNPKIAYATKHTK